MCHYCGWKIRQRIQGTGIQCPRYTYSNSHYEMQRRKVFVSVQLKNLNLNRALENIIISHGSPGNSLVLYLFPECRCVHVCMRTMCVQCMRTPACSLRQNISTWPGYLTRRVLLFCPVLQGARLVWERKEYMHADEQSNQRASLSAVLSLPCATTLGK